MPLVYPFFYYQSPKADGRKVRVAMHVDVAAAWNVVDALAPAGYRLGQFLFNHPPQEGEPREILKIARTRFRPSDLIVTATRFESEPPFSRDANRKQVQRGYTDLEAETEACWKQHIATSRRLFLKPQLDYADQFAPGYENRFRIGFFEAEGAPYKHLANAQERQNDSTPPVATAVYLLRVRELWRGGPGYLGFFGLDSTTTLVWSHLLRTRYPELLREDGFVIAELSGEIPTREEDLQFAEEWKSEIILRSMTRFVPKE